jgi:hypothetical protein
MYRSLLPASALALLAGVATAQQGLTIPGSVGPGPQTGAERPLLPSERFHVTTVGDRAHFVLDTVDQNALLIEDERDAASQPVRKMKLRVGVRQDIYVDVATHPEGWQNVPGGRLWTSAYHSPDAKAMRLQLVDIDVAEGGELWLYDDGLYGRVQGPFTGTGPFADGALWSTDLLDDTVYIEYFVPASAPTTGGFAVVGAQHIYRDIVEVGPQTASLGNCNPDVMCFPAWHPEHNATARITFVDGGTFLCSGTLLQSQANDFTPYFTTANHCVSTNSVASTVTSYWFFQTNSCNGSNASFSTADNSSVVATSGTVDSTLLMINGALPGGLTWSGWSTDVISNGTSITGIHHPSGERKKYWEGVRDNHAFGQGTIFFGVSFSLGVIEGGSSGSGMFRTSDHAFIGICCHGTAQLSCQFPNDPAGYGKWRWFFNNVTAVSNAMVAGSDDSFEPNDTCAAAASLSAGVHNDLVVKSVSEDWYAIGVAGCEELTVTTSHNNGWGDLDLELYDACNGSTLATALGGLSNKSVNWTNNSASPTTVYLRVFMGSGSSDTRNGYGLDVDIVSGGGNCGGIGTVYCSPAVNNSTNAPGRLLVTGSIVAVDNDITLTAYDLPPNQFGYFLASETQAFVQNPAGSTGNLCLGGNIARFTAQVQNSGAGGTFAIMPDLTAIPANPVHSIVAGETWNWQAWYRDVILVPTSNFTDAVSIFFF